MAWLIAVAGLAIGFALHWWLAAGLFIAVGAWLLAADRLPEIRPIDAQRDAAALQRLEKVREKLPDKYQHRNNFAWAVAQIAGLDKAEYFAHSGVDRKSELSSVAIRGIENISLRPKKGRFEVLCVNRGDEVEGEDCFPRYSDTEYKILEDMASRLPDPTARGRVRLYTDLPPCASCRHVMQQFLKAYPQVQLQVLYRGR